MRTPRNTMDKTAGNIPTGLQAAATAAVIPAGMCVLRCSAAPAAPAGLGLPAWLPAAAAPASAAHQDLPATDTAAAAGL